MTEALRIPFNYEFESDAAEAIAEGLRLRGHDAWAEYIGSNTSVFVATSPTRQVLMCGWGFLEDWQVDFEVLRSGCFERIEDKSEHIPDTATPDIDLLVGSIDIYLKGIEGYAPATAEIRPITERKAYNNILAQMYDRAGELSGTLREAVNAEADKPYVILKDAPDVKAALDIASDALEVAARLIEQATERTRRYIADYPESE